MLWHRTGNIAAPCRWMKPWHSVASEAGTAFDPAVVRALQARYRELEGRAKSAKVTPPPALSVDIKITRGSAPAAGFEAEAPVEIAAPRNPVAHARALRRKKEESVTSMPATGLCSLQWEEALLVAVHPHPAFHRL